MKRLSGLALVTALSACTTAPPPPVLSYTPVDCAAKPELARAVALAAAKRDGATVRTPIKADTPCVLVNGSKSPYLVYRMPADTDRMIDVGGAIEHARVFPPAVSTLDANGNTVRTFPAGQFYNRGGRYSVQFIPQEREEYIFVTVDQALVGTSVEEVATGTSVVHFGYGYWISGVDETVTRSRSYEGAVVATVFDTSPKPQR